MRVCQSFDKLSAKHLSSFEKPIKKQKKKQKNVIALRLRNCQIILKVSNGMFARVYCLISASLVIQDYRPSNKEIPLTAD